MTTIEIERPTLPKWLDSMINHHSNMATQLNEPLQNRPVKTLEWLKYYFGENEVSRSRIKYINDHENEILTAIIYGYEVEG